MRNAGIHIKYIILTIRLPKQHDLFAASNGLTRDQGRRVLFYLPQAYAVVSILLRRNLHKQNFSKMNVCRSFSANTCLVILVVPIELLQVYQLIISRQSVKPLTFTFNYNLKSPISYRFLLALKWLFFLRKRGPFPSVAAFPFNHFCPVLNGGSVQLPRQISWKTNNLRYAKNAAVG